MLVARSTGLSVLFAGLAVGGLAQQAPAPPAAQEPAPPAFETQVITLEPVHALVLPMKGSYAQHVEAFSRLGGFLAAKAVNPTGPPFARYFSDPSVGEANLLWEVGFPVPAGLTPEPPFEVKDLPATLAAVHVHRGPMEELGTAWPHMVEWILSNGYQPVGPAMHVFKGDLAAAPEVEMQMAVRK